MTDANAKKIAFGWPGIEPRWTRSDKQAIVTAYSASSPIWATLSAGIVNEVYFPTIDSPQIRDLQFLATDGETFFHDERRDTYTEIVRRCDESLWFKIVNRDREGRYRIEKDIITSPHAACLLINTRFVVEPQWQGKLKLFALLAPHLDVGGLGNNGVVDRGGQRIVLTAWRNESALALDCSNGLVTGSCGYVGYSDGWTDLSDNLKQDWFFNQAENGNIALLGEVDLSESTEFCLALGFGNTLHGAKCVVAESLAIPFDQHLERFREQWKRACKDRDDGLAEYSQDKGRLLRASHNMLLAHEDKTFHGAMIAGLSIPWGEAKGDDDLGGYHLVWPRDMVNSAEGLLAVGETETPFRALIYLASSQREDGGFYQNFWIDGRPFWSGIQLDEVAFPIMLAWRLKKMGLLRQFDPYPMVKLAAAYLVRQGPVTPQERWEEDSGYSPSTLAAHIASLICASEFAIERGEKQLAEYFAQYADFLRQHLERWTVTNQGSLLADVSRHFVRMLPVDPSDPHASEDLDSAEITIRNRAGDLKNRFPANEIIDAGFLELVRYGIWPAGDPLIEDSLRVVDAFLKVDTPNGPCWRRYNHDGYGQRDDGGPFTGAGHGRAWPLLAGERGHYELAAGRSVDKLIHAMESFSGETSLLPEQVWDEPDLAEAHMQFGRPSGSAMPLMWAHAEYLKLVRSSRDNKVFDRIDAVYDRYCGSNQKLEKFEIWKFNRQPSRLRRGDTLRIQADAPFRLRWTSNDWQTQSDADSLSPGMDVHFYDLKPAEFQTGNVHFTFWWPDSENWEGRDFSISVEHHESSVAEVAETSDASTKIRSPAATALSKM